MKKLNILFALSGALLLVPSFSSCAPSSNKVQLMYGTYAHEEALDIDFPTLERKMNVFKENMLVALYPGKDTHCNCWFDFKMIIDDYVKTTKTMIYTINVFELRANHNDWGFILDNASPTFAITKNGQIAHKFTYENPSDLKIFQSTMEFKTMIDTLTIPSKYMIVDEAYLNKRLFIDKKDSIVFYTKDTCPDCMYAVPHVLAPYQERKALKEEVLIFDLDPLSKKEDNSYQEFKDKFLLSVKNNEVLGYDRGYVPTYQVYKSGNLMDMGVYFNDTLEEIDGTYQVIKSYYTEERVKNLHYLTDIKTKVLLGLKLDKDEVNVIDYKGQKILRWKEESSNKYHEAFLTSFLDKYAI